MATLWTVHFQADDKRIVTINQLLPNLDEAALYAHQVLDKPQDYILIDITTREPVSVNRLVDVYDFIPVKDDL